MLVATGLGPMTRCAVRLSLAARRGRPRDAAPTTRRDRSVAPHERFGVLVVDDDRDLLDALKDLLELRGFVVYAATDLRGALSQAESNSPDAALVDVKLGRDNGLDVVPELKRRCPQICCLVMTAYPDARYATLAFESGADGFLYKPLDAGTLVRNLDSRLGKLD